MIPVIHFRTGGQQPGNKLRPIPLQRRNQSCAFEPVADIDIRSRLKQFLQYFELSSLRRNRQNGLRPVILIFLFDIGAGSQKLLHFRQVTEHGSRVKFSGRQQSGDRTSPQNQLFQHDFTTI